MASTPITYRELRNELKNLSDTELDKDVIINDLFDGQNLFYVTLIGSDEDHGHPKQTVLCVDSSRLII